MSECISIPRYRLVPWSTQDPSAPKDLDGWAYVPEELILDPVELEQRLRSLTPELCTDPMVERAHAMSLREELIREGGRPTRSLQTFDGSQADPETVALYDVEFGLYELYINESHYWQTELESWRNFIKCNAPRLDDIDQVSLFREYSAYQERKIQTFDKRLEQLDGSERWISRGRREDMVARLHLIQQQLIEVQNEEKKIGCYTGTNSLASPPSNQERRQQSGPRRSARVAKIGDKRRKHPASTPAPTSRNTCSRTTTKRLLPSRSSRQSRISKPQNMAKTRRRKKS